MPFPLSGAKPERESVREPHSLTEAVERALAWVQTRWPCASDGLNGEPGGSYKYHVIRVYSDAANPAGVRFHVWIDRRVPSSRVGVGDVDDGLRALLAAALPLSPPDTQIVLWITQVERQVRLAFQVHLPAGAPAYVLDLLDAMGSLDPFAPGRQSPQFARGIQARWHLERAGGVIDVTRADGGDRQFCVVFPRE